MYYKTKETVKVQQKLLLFDLVAMRSNPLHSKFETVKETFM